MSEDARRALPSIDRVVGELAATTHPALPHVLLVDCARAAVDEARLVHSEGRSMDADAVVTRARRAAKSLAASLLQPLVNATGVIVHTNLGRAPLPSTAIEGLTEIAAGYSNLEFELADGRRGSRHAHAGGLLARAVGAQAGIAVNNNAAAVLLVLATLARGREVVVSRGELVEIGGGFRIPDVMAESGARLVEVGTTNRTRVGDYEAALTDSTAALLKVHASNYRVEGFVESTSIDALAGLGPPVVFDAGSGLLDETTPWLAGGAPSWLGDEPGVRQALDAGAAVVTFSGDKLLGGPQAGVVVGRSPLIERIARHPLARAVRADKLTLAALQAVAVAYLDGRAGELPLWRMATLDLGRLRERAGAMAASVPRTEIVDTESVIGGGALPGRSIASVGLALAAPGGRGKQRADALRHHGVIARIDTERLILDLRTIEPAQDAVVVAALKAVADR